MITPPDRRTITLLTVWSQPDKDGRLKMCCGPDVIARFFPELTQEGIERVLGPGGWRRLTPKEARLCLQSEPGVQCVPGHLTGARGGFGGP